MSLCEFGVWAPIACNRNTMNGVKFSKPGLGTYFKWKFLCSE